MARYVRSGQWSRPASSAQIRALRSHGGYDGKYYSMGRASQAIQKGMNSSSGGARQRYAPPASPRTSTPYRQSDAFDVVASIMGVESSAQALIAEALARVNSHNSDAGAASFLEPPVEEMVITINEIEPDGPHANVTFNASVAHNSDHSGGAEVRMEFSSNIAFAESAEWGERSESGGVEFTSGVTFDD